MSITEFRGTYLFLSNFYPSWVWFEGEHYPTVEHAFHAAKTTDKAERLEIKEAPTPGKAKKLGRRVKLRPDWESVKLEIMEDLLTQKFHPSRNPVLSAKLVETTSNRLEEGNTWGDQFWGVCKGVGHNHLGRLLMVIRKRLAGGDTGYDPIGGGGGHGRSDLPYGQGGGGD